MIETAAHTNLQLVFDNAFCNQKLFADAMDTKMVIFLLSVCHKPQKTLVTDQRVSNHSLLSLCFGTGLGEALIRTSCY